MDITLVGTGNVAFALARLLVASGHSVIDVCGRNLERLQQISALTGAIVKTNLRDINKGSDVCLLAVADAAIEEVAAQINIDTTLVVHTSGATSKMLLKRFSGYGVLYPLQSLRKEMIHLPSIPFFIDANNENNVDILRKLATSTGNTATIAGDEERLKLHLAAVLCSNFTNHLYALTEAFCKKENIDFANLLPLIRETSERLLLFPAARLQTGPAIRHDDNTIQRHLQVLQSYPQLSSLYHQLTSSIQTFAADEHC